MTALDRLILTAGLLVGLADCATAGAFETKHGDVVIRLTDKPCAESVTVLLRTEAHDKYLGGHVTLRGVKLALCWRLTDGGNVLVIDEKGDGGILPISRFQKVPTL